MHNSTNSNEQTKLQSNVAFIRQRYLLQNMTILKKLSFKTIMVIVFLLTYFMSSIRRFRAARKTSVFTEVRGWQKKEKNVLVRVEEEKETLTLIILF